MPGTRIIKSIFIVLFLFPFGLAAQYLKVEGYVLGQDNDPLAGANVYFSNDFGDYTDENGFFTFQVPQSVLPANDSVLIHTSYIGYIPQSKVIFPGNRGGAEVVFHLSRDSYLLETVTISTSPQVKYKSDDEWVLDFVFEGDGLLILTKKGSSVFLKYQDGIERTTGSIEIPHQADRLERSCMGDLHVIGETLCSQVAFEKGGFTLVDQYPSEKFAEVVEPCVYYTAHGEFIFGHNQDFNQSVLYRQFAPEGKLRWRHHVYDEAQVAYAYGEFRRLLKVYEQQVASRDPNSINYDFPIENLLENQEWDGNLMDLVIDNTTMKYVSYFSNIVMKEIYAPLFVYRGEVVIFDQLNESLVAYQLPQMEQVREVPLAYIQETGTVKEILQDVQTEKLYAKTTSGKNLKLMEINPFDGTIVHEHNLPTDLHFETGLKMRDGILYYLAQPHPDKPHKRIYQQKVW